MISIIQIDHCSTIPSNMKTFLLALCLVLIATSSVFSFPVNDEPEDVGKEVSYEPIDLLKILNLFLIKCRGIEDEKARINCLIDVIFAPDLSEDEVSSCSLSQLSF